MGEEQKKNAAGLFLPLSNLIKWKASKTRYQQLYVYRYHEEQNYSTQQYD